VTSALHHASVLSRPPISAAYLRPSTTVRALGAVTSAGGARGRGPPLRWRSHGTFGGLIGSSPDRRKPVTARRKPRAGSRAPESRAPESRAPDAAHRP
jgi:hypothetical protein